MANEQYSSGIIAESFWFIEFKMLITMRTQGMSWEAISERCLNENLFNVSKPYRAKRIFNYLKNRVLALSDSMLEYFMKSDLATQKIIAFIAVMKSNPLFFEFVYEVYRGNLLLGKNELTRSQIMVFFHHRQSMGDLGEWSEPTLKRMCGTYLNFMKDSGLLTYKDKRYFCTPPFLPVLEQQLKIEGDSALFQAMNGGN